MEPDHPLQQVVDALRDQLLAAAERERRLRHLLRDRLCACEGLDLKPHDPGCWYVSALELEGLSPDPS